MHICHDCGGDVQQENCAEYETSLAKFYKCQSCFEKDALLRDYQETEVYSRVVGYMRPTKQWNKGKQEEFDDRKEFIIQDN